LVCSLKNNVNGFNARRNTTYNQNNIQNTTYVGWQWNAGSGSSTVPTGGSITPTGASINVSAGFSVIAYTGTVANATIPHGLGATPSLIITKRRTTFTSGWGVWHTALSGTQYLLLNTTDATLTAATAWNSTTPTSIVFSVGNASFCNGSVDSYIAYCWAPVSGYSAFGTYTANASTDGPMVFLNFRPRFVLLKNTTRALDWITYDSSRDLYNTETQQLYPNLFSAEAAGANIDFLSNGFKIRGASGSGINNTSGDVYIYAAFAENPFRMALAR
jgi:hypothetical protein